jgi:Spy/CpxP family protein refolding chaperone
MKHLILIFGLALLTPAASRLALAQEDQAAPSARKQIENLKERLKLTPEQVEKVKPILEQQRQKLRELREQSGGERSRRGRVGMARQARKIRKETDAELKQILSPEQMKELDKIREERRGRARERMRR